MEYNAKKDVCLKHSTGRKNAFIILFAFLFTGLISVYSQTTSSSTTTSITLQDVKLLFIRGGTFTMGSPASEPGRSDRETQHVVAVYDFYLSEKEITNEQYCRFLNEIGVRNNGYITIPVYGYVRLIEKSEWGVQYSYSSYKWIPAGDADNHPVRNVSWYGAMSYCAWAGGRLPTEAEWEYACRAGTTTPFNTGNNITTSQANYNGIPYNNNDARGTYLRRTQSVGSYVPNAWGLYDMQGNVSEWCSDWHGVFGPGDEGSIDPQGPSSGSYRVWRGGNWYFSAACSRSSYRNYFHPASCDNYIGFRIACSSN